MRINSIQNYNNFNSVSFGAKFRKKDIKELISYTYVMNDDDKSSFPKLYTMLKYLEECPGDVAYLEYVTKGKDNCFRPVKSQKERYEIIENNFEKPLGVRIYTIPKEFSYQKKHYIGEDYEGASPFDALKDATVTDKDEHYDYVHMPERIFEQEWWKNRDKTTEDIKKLAIDA